MSITFKDLQRRIANDIFGFDEPEDLDGDLALVKGAINRAYRECYLPERKARPPWTQQYLSFLMPKAESVTLNLTKGSTAVSGHTFDENYTGSAVKIGEDFYTYAGDNKLIEPWKGESAALGATVYHNSYKLPVSAITLCDVPERMGWGPLSPMTKEMEIRYRTIMASDFYPASTPRYENFSGLRASHSHLTVGDPMFYFIDSASVSAVFDPGHRFVVSPIPQNTETIRLRANIVPAGMTADADVPLLIADTVEDILVPLAKAKAAGESKNFNGNNIELLMREAEGAKAKLISLTRMQKQTGGRIRIRPGW